MTGPADPISARFAQIQANREAATSATRASTEESRTKTDDAGAAVHARPRNRLSALRRRSAERRDGWGEEEISIGVGEEDDEAAPQDVVRPHTLAPGDEELEGRDWLR